MKILLSIKPKYANLIFDGIKKFEFRKKIPKNRSIKSVVVYASAPISKVIGEFEIDEFITKDLETLWQETHQFSGISKEFFMEYFKNQKEGNAIKIKSFTRYKDPINLMEGFNTVPPQSYKYLEIDSLGTQKMLDLSFN